MLQYFIAVCFLACIVNAQGQANVTNVCTGRRPGFFVRDVRRCESYFFCHPDGRALLDACDAPLVFDEPRQMCNFRQNVACFTCPANEFRSQRRVNGTCNQFIQCINNIPDHRFCPSNLNFNPTTNQCELGVVCSPQNPPPQCPPVSDPLNPIYIRNETDCSRYQFCENGVAINYRCPTGMHFNLEIQMCDRIENAGCKNGGNGEGPGNFICPPGDGNPFHAHPTDCVRYFICAAGVAHPFTCPSNTIFDHINRECRINGVCINQRNNKHK